VGDLIRARVVSSSGAALVARITAVPGSPATAGRMAESPLNAESLWSPRNPR
jgi:hypothetical protein